MGKKLGTLCATFVDSAINGLRATSGRPGTPRASSKASAEYYGTGDPSLGVVAGHSVAQVLQVLSFEFRGSLMRQVVLFFILCSTYHCF